MRRVSLRICATAAVAALASWPALAQQRPSEGEIFGGEPQTSQEPPPPALQIKEDPLKIGGLIYLRAFTTWQEGVPLEDWPLSAPALVDGYLDVRPNDRVRGFLLARLQYDLARARTSGNATALPAGTVASTLGLSAENPLMLLDQLWVNFDVERTVFVTAGKQHVKWGVGHFWNPTDFLHPVRRDPLAVFDARTGQTMLKLHLPWEKRGWNFYGMAVFDESQPVGQLGNVGAAARAEVVFGTAELAIDGLVQRGKDARLGIDFSAGIWEFDVYGEAALRKGSDVTLFRQTPVLVGPVVIGEPYEPEGLRPAVTAGVSWSYKYSDEDSLTLGAEYFYNANGYDDATLYPFLIAQQYAAGQTYFTPFYLGRHYLGLYLLLPKPGSWNDTTFTLSTIGNLSDHTFVTRLDYSVLLLTYLTLEAYVAGHYGTAGGELRFALDLPAGLVPNLPAVHVAPPVLDFGVALRVSL